MDTGPTPTQSVAAPGQSSLNATALLTQSIQIANSGLHERAIPAIQEAAATLAVLDAGEPGAHTRLHADACRILALSLIATGRHAAAILAYQEAADAYGKLDDCAELARECAHEVVVGVRESWRRPGHRIELLIVRLERDLRLLEARAGSSLELGDACTKLATLLQRQEMARQAIAYFERALQYYSIAGELRQQADCHWNVALLHSEDLNSLDQAEHHCAAAIHLYEQVEPNVHVEVSCVERAQALMVNLRERCGREQTGEVGADSN